MQTLTAIASRKSTRGYKAEQLPENVLETIVSAGRSAPVAMAQFGTLHITVIQNAELLTKISAAGAAIYNKPGLDTLYGAPTLALVSSQDSGIGPEIGVANVACVVENMCIAATDMGIGSVYIAGAVRGLKLDTALLSTLALPDGFVPVAAVALGYAVEPLVETDTFNNRIAVSHIR